MSSAQIGQIRDDELKQLMERANGHLDKGENLACVQVCADAYLGLLEKHPEVRVALEKVLEVETVKKALEVGSLRFAPLHVASTCGQAEPDRSRETRDHLRPSHPGL